MTSLVVFVWFMAYWVVVGFMQPRIKRRLEGRCTLVNHTNCEHTQNAGVLAFCWLVAMPFLVGEFLSNKTDSQLRLEEQRAKELEQARHDSGVAAERRLEAEELARRLRALGKGEL